MNILTMVSHNIDLYVLTFPCYNNSTSFVPIQIVAKAPTWENFLVKTT